MSPSGCPALSGLSSRLRSGCGQALGPRLGQRFAKKPGGGSHPASTPTLGLWLIGEGSGGFRREGEAGQLWSAHVLPPGFIFGLPASSPAAA